MIYSLSVVHETLWEWHRIYEIMVCNLPLLFIFWQNMITGTIITNIRTPTPRKVKSQIQSFLSWNGIYSCIVLLVSSIEAVMTGMVDKWYVVLVLFKNFKNKKNKINIKQYIPYDRMTSQLALICILNVNIFWDLRFYKLYKKLAYLIQVGSARKHPLPIRTQLLSMRKFLP